MKYPEYQYPYLWNGRPCKVIRQISGTLTEVRAPDPYDVGEVQFVVETNELIKVGEEPVLRTVIRL